MKAEKAKVKKVKQKKAKTKKPSKLQKAFQSAFVDTIEQLKKMFGVSGGGVSSKNSSDTPEDSENPPSSDEVK